MAGSLGRRTPTSASPQAPQRDPTTSPDHHRHRHQSRPRLERRPLTCAPPSTPSPTPDSARTPRGDRTIRTTLHTADGAQQLRAYLASARILTLTSLAATGTVGIVLATLHHVLVSASLALIGGELTGVLIILGRAQCALGNLPQQHGHRS